MRFLYRFKILLYKPTLGVNVRIVNFRNPLTYLFIILCILTRTKSRAKKPKKS